MHIHILGICGTFMGGLAALAREAGHRVTGCDAGVYPPMSDQLRALGIELVEGYGADQLAFKPDMFVIGNTVSRSRTEAGAVKFPLIEAILDAGAPYTSGPQWLAEHVLQGRHVLAVAGTHGKTTTTAMLSWILECAGLQPGFLVGGVPLNFGVSARLGAPTLPAARGSLPPEGADSPWGGPAGNLAPTLPAARGSLPPEGADSPWGGPAGNRAPTLPAARGSLPPEGADSPWGGPAGNRAPTLPAARGSLPPEGADSPWGGPAGNRAPTLPAARGSLPHEGADSPLRRPVFVIEADEYDTAFFDKRSKFVHYRPRTAVLNNLEFDHADIFDNIAAIERQFHHLVRTVPGGGRIVVNGLEESLARVLHMGCWSTVRSFGSAVSDFSAVGEPHDFAVLQGGEPVARVQWALGGVHNQLNALAAIAAAEHVGVSAADAALALATFENVKRRMEVRARIVLTGAPGAAPVTIYDDFAHHPTAIRTTVNGLRRSVGAARILAVFEPRSNTMKLGTMKAQLPWSLEEVDLAFCHGGGLGWDATEALAPMGERAQVAPNIDALAAMVAAQAREGDHILCMSNGGFGGVHDKIAALLRAG